MNRGRRDTYFNDVDLIQQIRGKWHWVSAPVADGPVPFPRGCHSAQLTADGNMLVLVFEHQCSYEQYLTGVGWCWASIDATESPRGVEYM